MENTNLELADKEKQESQSIQKADLKYLMENEVPYAIISVLNLFKEPLNLSKLSKITAYPITTIIHHLPSLLEKNLIVHSKVPHKRGKYYFLSEKSETLLSLSDSERIPQEIFDELEQTKNMNIEEYQKHLKEYYKGLVGKSKDFNENSLNMFLSFAIFNKNITNFSKIYFSKLILKIKNGEKLDFDLPLTFISNFISSFSFSSVFQIKEFQKIYISFFNDLIDFKNKIDNENKENESKIIETSYFYLSTCPVIKIEKSN